MVQRISSQDARQHHRLCPASWCACTNWTPKASDRRAHARLPRPTTSSARRGRMGARAVGGHTSSSRNTVGASSWMRQSVLLRGPRSKCRHRISAPVTGLSCFHLVEGTPCDPLSPSALQKSENAQRREQIYVFKASKSNVASANTTGFIAGRLFLLSASQRVNVFTSNPAGPT